MPIKRCVYRKLNSGFMDRIGKVGAMAALICFRGCAVALAIKKWITVMSARWTEVPRLARENTCAALIEPPKPFVKGQRRGGGSMSEWIPMPIQ